MAILTRTAATTDWEPNTTFIEDSYFLSIVITETAPNLFTGAQKTT